MPIETHRRRVVTGLLAVTIAVLTLGAGPLPPTAVTLGVEGRSNATPWVASDGPNVAVVWGATVDGKTDVFVAVSRDSGASFGKAVQVNTLAGEARLGGELPPRVALMPAPGSVESRHCRALDSARRRHGHQDRTIARRRQDVRAARDAPGLRRSRRSRLALPGAGLTWHRARDLAGSSKAGGRSRARRPAGQTRARRTRRRGDGAEVWSVLRNGRQGRVNRARTGSGRLLLLQDRPGDRSRRVGVRRVASRVPGQLPRHGLHILARWRQNICAARPRERGRVGHQRLSRRRALPSRWTGPVPCTSCGPPSSTAPLPRARCSMPRPGTAGRSLRARVSPRPAVAGRPTRRLSSMPAGAWSSPGMKASMASASRWRAR